MTHPDTSPTQEVRELVEGFVCGICRWTSIVQLRRAWNDYKLATVNPMCPADEMIKLVLKANDLGVKP